MSDELKDQVDLELAMLRQLFQEHHALLNGTRSAPPDRVQLLALAAILHSFYNGVENIWKRTAVQIDGHYPQGAAWHIDLLNSMARSTPLRPPLISSALRDLLRGFLDFRHFFRHAYSFLLEWHKIAPLVAGCEAALDRLQTELREFFVAREKREPQEGTT